MAVICRCTGVILVACTSWNWNWSKVSCGRFVTQNYLLDLVVDHHGVIYSTVHQVAQKPWLLRPWRLSPTSISLLSRYIRDVILCPFCTIRFRCTQTNFCKCLQCFVTFFSQERVIGLVYSDLYHRYYWAQCAEQLRAVEVWLCTMNVIVWHCNCV